MPLVASFQVADGLAGSCGGVLRGQGQLSKIIIQYTLLITGKLRTPTSRRSFERYRVLHSCASVRNCHGLSSQA